MGSEEIAREYFEAWNRRDFDRIEALVADDAEVVDFDGTVSHGPSGARSNAEMYATAFPDGRIDIKRIVAAGEFAVAELVGTGTNDGPFGDVPATHREVRLPFCDVLTVRDGKIVRDRGYADTATMLRQLGLMPELAHA